MTVDKNGWLFRPWIVADVSPEMKGDRSPSRAAMSTNFIDEVRFHRLASIQSVCIIAQDENDGE